MKEKVRAGSGGTERRAQRRLPALLFQVIIYKFSLQLLVLFTFST